MPTVLEFVKSAATKSPFGELSKTTKLHKPPTMEGQSQSSGGFTPSILSKQRKMVKSQVTSGQTALKKLKAGP